MLKAIEPITKENVVLGQYLGTEDGSQPGYKEGELRLCAVVVYWFEKGCTCSCCFSPMLSGPFATKK